MFSLIIIIVGVLFVVYCFEDKSEEKQITQKRKVVQEQSSDQSSSDSEVEIIAKCPYCGRKIYEKDLDKVILIECKGCGTVFPRGGDTDILILNIVVLAAIVAKIDGVVTKEEIEVFDNWVRQSGYSTPELKFLAGRFNNAKDYKDYKKWVNNLRCFHITENEKSVIFDLLVSIVCTNVSVTIEQKNILCEIKIALEINDIDYEKSMSKIVNGYSSQENILCRDSHEDEKNFDVNIQFKEDVLSFDECYEEYSGLAFMNYFNIARELNETVYDLTLNMIDMHYNVTKGDDTDINEGLLLPLLMHSRLGSFTKCSFKILQSRHPELHPEIYEAILNRLGYPKLIVRENIARAKNGDAQAQLFLGNILFQGIGCQENNEEAYKWFCLAAKQGDKIAQCRVGEMHQYGFGVSQDYTQAAQWYKKSADQGYHEGQFRLAWLYEKGRGVTKDIASAEQLYLLSSAQGNVMAMGYAASSVQIDQNSCNYDECHDDINEHDQWHDGTGYDFPDHETYRAWMEDDEH